MTDFRLRLACQPFSEVTLLLHVSETAELSAAVCAGLDARAAMIVMQSIKNVSRNGRTVMVTIHQPSIDIFESFDALVLLRRGGTVSARLSMPIAGNHAQGEGPSVHLRQPDGALPAPAPAFVGIRVRTAVAMSRISTLGTYEIGAGTGL